MLNHPFFGANADKGGAEAGADEITPERYAKLQEEVSNLNKALHERTVRNNELKAIIEKNENIIGQANSIIAYVEALKAQPTIAGLAQLVGKSEDDFKKALGMPKGTDSETVLTEEDIPPKLMNLIESKFTVLQNEVIAAKKELENQKTESQKQREAQQAQEFAGEVEKIRQHYFSDIPDEDWLEIYPNLLLKVSKHGFKDGAEKTREWVDKFSKKGYDMITKKEKEVAERNRLELLQKGLPISELPAGGFKSFEDAEAAFDKTSERTKPLFEGLQSD